MTDSVQEFIDKQALHELVLRYCRACDRRDFPQLRALYHDDAIDDHGTMFHGTADEYVAWLPRVMENFEATVHSVTNSLFVLAGDAAQGEIYTVAYHRTHPPQAQEVVIGGRYLDHYERRGGTWKFKRRALALDWCRVTPVQEAAYREFAAGAPRGRTDHEDPSYLALSYFRRGRS
jgi:hypothetical protein